MAMKKYLKIGPYGIGACAIVAVAVLLRVTLDALNWPVTISDEGSMGLMAIHIAYHGEIPLVLYGQSYMGSLEAFLGSVFIRIFGISPFSLRLGVILLFTLFLITMYFLTSLLFSKKLALFTLALLSLGSDPMLSHEIIATGGSTQTLLFGSLAFLIISWLVLSIDRPQNKYTSLWRYLAYLGLGLVIGLGLWSDMVVAPYFAMAGLLLVIFCWRELLSPAPLFLFGGLLFGLMPLLVFNYESLNGTNSVYVLLSLFQGSGAQSVHTLSHTLHNILSTIQVSLPMATGEPFCPVNEWPWIGDNSPRSPICAVAHGSWGVSFLVLLFVVILLSASAVWKLRRQAGTAAPKEDIEQQQVSTATAEEDIEQQQERKKIIIRFVMLASAAIDIIIYAFSSAPSTLPGQHARYLIGLLIIMPAILAPLWHGASALTRSLVRTEQVKAIACRCILAFIFVVFLAGTIFTFMQVPAAQNTYQQDEALVHDLERIGVTHMYAEYWTCNRSAFLSDERITCAVVDNNLNLDWFHSRYKPYIPLIQHDPHAAYVCPLFLSYVDGEVTSLEKKASQPGAHYQRYIFEGYLVLVPTS